MKKKSLRLLAVLVLALCLMLSMAAPAFAVSVGYGPVFTTNLPNEMWPQKGAPFQMSVAVNSNGLPVSYQWYTSEGPIQGANSANVTITAQYNTIIWCEVYCNGVPASSNRCQLLVQDPNMYPSPTVAPTPIPTVVPTQAPTGALTAPTITSQPAAANIQNGQSATLTVGATAPNLGYGVALAYQWYCSSSADGSNAVAITGASMPSYTVSATAANKYYFAAVWATNGYSNSAPVYTQVVPVTYNSGVLKITKQPTGETVDVGGSALFIARADNATSHVWRLVSADTTKTVNATDAHTYFPGLSVLGADSDTLTLLNIPAALNGWSVECKFIGAAGTLYSNGAIIKVRGSEPSPSISVTERPTVTATILPTPTPTPAAQGGSLAAPSISTQPVGAVLAEGETTTLSVAASSSDGAALNYQWYRSDVNSNANGTAIAGAQGSSYVPDTISGSRYYYVGVWASNGSSTSKVSYSTPVAVTYTAPISTPSPSPAPTAPPQYSGRQDSSLLSSLIVPIIVMLVAAIAIGVGVFFLLKGSGKKSKDCRDDYDRYFDDFDDDGDDYPRRRR